MYACIAIYYFMYGMYVVKGVFPRGVIPERSPIQDVFCLLESSFEPRLRASVVH
jgi:hypothetical protein